MNIRFLSLPLVAATFLALAGCASPTVVTLQNGTQYLTKDIPNTRTSDGFYEFEDISGKKVRVRADDVATIRKED
ncbi:YgdI/YgdR family lipoprotein [Pseudomonas citri]|uniref:YgdI/YgdR family lipoprotein n=1 Tax=Pseudomonas citri TaxID=2978349 RepID=UPI0021B58270|nr:YgdI/YgdR family lipoprotein [Pseudomonas citri]